MSQKGLSIGRDATITIIRPNGSSLPLGKITQFQANQKSSDEDVDPINSPQITLRHYEGWIGSWNQVRTGPEVDEFFARSESDYFAGVDEVALMMQVTIVEPNGTVSQFRYEGVTLKYDEAGTWEAKKSVSQKISFTASRRFMQ